MAARSKALGFFASARSAAKLLPGEVMAPSGMPTLPHTVTIFAPARSPMQQGMARMPVGGLAPCWRVAFGMVGGVAKWPNPIIGWTSTGDPLENVARAANGMAFETKEEAVAYCEKYGLQYTVKEPAPKFMGRPPRFQGYGDKYSVKRNGIPEGGLRSMAGSKGKA